MNSNQLELLARCRRQGYITPKDVNMVYPFWEPQNYRQFRKLNKIKLRILRGLELKGYIIQVSKFKWKLRRNGQKVLEEREIWSRNNKDKNIILLSPKILDGLKEERGGIDK